MITLNYENASTAESASECDTVTYIIEYIDTDLAVSMPLIASSHEKKLILHPLHIH